MHVASACRARSRTRTCVCVCVGGGVCVWTPAHARVHVCCEHVSGVAMCTGAPAHTLGGWGGGGCVEDMKGGRGGMRKHASDRALRCGRFQSVKACWNLTGLVVCCGCGCRSHSMASAPSTCSQGGVCTSGEPSIRCPSSISDVLPVTGAPVLPYPFHNLMS
jgi:hypothetical protein